MKENGYPDVDKLLVAMYDKNEKLYKNKNSKLYKENFEKLKSIEFAGLLIKAYDDMKTKDKK